MFITVLSLVFCPSRLNRVPSITLVTGGGVFMLLEVGAAGVAIAGVMFGYEGVRKLFKKKNDQKVIEDLFKNVKCGIPKKDYVEYPTLITKSVGKEGKLYDTYIYRVPLGIPFSKFATLTEHLQDGLGRDVKIDCGDCKAKIMISKEPLSEKIPLDPFLNKTKDWNVLIGVNAFEVATHNFEHYPMIIGGGATRFGKTVLLKNIITQLILQNPDDVRFVIIDLKGGLEFWDFEELPQVVKVIDNPFDAFKFLGNLAEEWLPARFAFFRQHKYRNIVDTPIKERTFLIIDECHDLFKNTDPRLKPDVKKKIEHFIAKLASMGGGLGLRIMAFTQYPVKEAMPQFLKQNAPVRIGFQVADGTASRVIIDQDGLQDLPMVAGRAMVKSYKYQTVQVPAPLTSKGKMRDHFEYVKHFIQKGEEPREPEYPIKVRKGNGDPPIARQTLVPK